jgi:hypothetical protein
MSSPGMTLLVSVEELAAHPEWRVFDCRHDLKNTGYGRQAYARGHIPGALFLHLDEDLSGATTGGNGRHPLPAIDAFARRMSDCGVDASTQVVAYDNEGGIFARACGGCCAGSGMSGWPCSTAAWPDGSAASGRWKSRCRPRRRANSFPACRI